MKLGVISDIHGNLEALKAVIAMLKSKEVQIVINTGDNVGYSAHPEECLELIKSFNVFSVQGNYDDAVAFDRQECGCGKGDKLTRKLRHASLEWTTKNVRPEWKKYLGTLPRRNEIVIRNRTVFAAHGSPSTINEFIYKDDIKALKRVAGSVDAEIIILGHTHQPYVVNIDGKLMVNSGSVGKPEDGSPEASFAVIDLEGAPSASLYRTPYDVEKNISDLLKAGLPGEIAMNLRTGCPFSGKLQ